MEASTWKQFFTQWPTELPRRGILITSFGEHVPFSGFFTGEAFLLLERQTPDTAGARFVLLRYENVDALKIIDVVKSGAIRQMGLAGPASRR
jgi:hypothetical protein